MPAAAKSQASSKTPTLRIVPAIPGYLLIGEIAKLAGVKDTTIRGYRLTKAAGFPQEDSRAGTTPMWSIDTIVDWLGTRWASQTKVAVHEDGSLEVVAPSEYKAIMARNAEARAAEQASAPKRESASAV